MSITLRYSEDRGIADFGWLNSKHSFSFGYYYDPNYMGFGNLRVINEDRVTAGKGFPPHGHRDMEILTYVFEGSLEHKDSMGHVSIIKKGYVQLISAGTGILHSEFNYSNIDDVRFLQIWIYPYQKGLKPSYDQKYFPDVEKKGFLRLLVSPDGRDRSMVIHQDVNLYASILQQGESVTHNLGNKRHAWLQVVKGSLELNNFKLKSGDGVGITEENNLVITGINDAEFLLFDMG